MEVALEKLIEQLVEIRDVLKDCTDGSLATTIDTAIECVKFKYETVLKSHGEKGSTGDAVSEGKGQQDGEEKEFCSRCAKWVIPKRNECPDCGNKDLAYDATY